MDNLTFLFAAFSVIWFALFIFLLRLAKKLTSLERIVQQLQDR